MNTLRILAPVPTLRCTGPRTKAHFTFKTSQGKLQNHRLIITLLLSQQLAPWFPATDLLLQTGCPPHYSTSVSCSYSQWNSGCLSLSFSKFYPSLVPLLTWCLWTAPACGDFFLWGLFQEHWDHFSWSFIGTEKSLVDLRRGSQINCDLRQASRLSSLCFSLLICKVGEWVIKVPRFSWGLDEFIDVKHLDHYRLVHGRHGMIVTCDCYKPNVDRRHALSSFNDSVKSSALSV